ncbi:MAG: RNA methyltransferase [Lachnospiraceae bacterium]|nr:RNA methyltransferase [Lachnospiraceae bacterium]
MIESPSNPKLKRIRQLLDRSRARREEDAFVVEGLRSFREIPEDDIIEVFISQSFRKDHPDIQGEIIKENIFNHLSDTQNPQGILAVVRQRHYTIEQIMRSSEGLLLILEGIQDPGNLGTMLRVGEGAGVSGILMDRNTADIYSPKVVRSTMGSIFRVPFLYSSDLPDLILGLKEEGVRIYSSHPKAEQLYFEAEYPKKTAFLIGNEGRGLSDELSSLADERISIPMMGKTESLNAAISAALLMYQYRTQRMKKRSV